MELSSKSTCLKINFSPIFPNPDSSGFLTMKFLCLDVDGVPDSSETPFFFQHFPTLSLSFGVRALQSIVSHVPVLILSGGHSVHFDTTFRVWVCTPSASLATTSFQLCRVAGYPNLKQPNVLYVGDGLNDLECLQQVGFSACPSDADPQVSAAVKFRSAFQGGHGAIADALNWAMNPPV